MEHNEEISTMSILYNILSRIIIVTINNDVFIFERRNGTTTQVLHESKKLRTQSRKVRSEMNERETPPSIFRISPRLWCVVLSKWQVCTKKALRVARVCSIFNKRRWLFNTFGHEGFYYFVDKKEKHKHVRKKRGNRKNLCSPSDEVYLLIFVTNTLTKTKNEHIVVIYTKTIPKYFIFTKDFLDVLIFGKQRSVSNNTHNVKQQIHTFCVNLDFKFSFLYVSILYVINRYVAIIRKT